MMGCLGQKKSGTTCMARMLKSARVVIWKFLRIAAFRPAESPLFVLLGIGEYVTKLCVTSTVGSELDGELIPAEGNVKVIPDSWPGLEITDVALSVLTTEGVLEEGSIGGVV